MVLRKLFCRIGSKTKIAKLVIKTINKISPNHRTYVEPFVGSGAVYFAIEKRPLTKEVLNDKDKDLINAYKLVKRTSLPEDDGRSPSSADRDRNALFKRLNGYNRSNESLTNFYKSKGGSNIEKLGKAIVKYCGTSSSKGSGPAYSSKHSNFINKIKNLDKYKERMKDTIFHSMDWKAVVNKYDSPPTLFYLDPPYEDSQKLYEHGVIDMVDLHSTLKQLKGQWVL
jgi:DNA adenine methylase